MKLTEYKKINGLRWKDIAKVLRISPSHLSMILRNERKMPPLVARRIEDFTDGAVTIYEALGQELPVANRLRAIAGTLLFIADYLGEMQDAKGDIEGILAELYAVKELVKAKT